MRDHKPKNKPVFGGNFCDYPQKVKYIYPSERIFFAYDSLFFFRLLHEKIYGDFAFCFARKMKNAKKRGAIGVNRAVYFRLKMRKNYQK